MKRIAIYELAAESENKITQKHVKLCTLCGALNYLENAECWTCRWHGAFSCDEQTVALAWQRLELLYEEVRLEHLTSRKMRALGDFGRLRPRSRWQTILNRALHWRQICAAGRSFVNPAPSAASRGK